MPFQPITFTRTDERGTHTLVATSATQAVKLRFDGWTEEKDPKAKPLQPLQPAADGTFIDPNADADGEGEGDSDGGKTRRSTSKSSSK